MKYNRRSKLFIDPDIRYCQQTRHDWAGTVVTAKDAILSVCMHLYGLCLPSRELKPMIALANANRVVGSVSPATKWSMIRDYKPAFLISVTTSPDPEWSGCLAYYFWRSQSGLVLATCITDCLREAGLIAVRDPAITPDKRRTILTRSPSIGVIIVLGSVNDPVFAQEAGRIGLAKCLRDGIVRARAALPAQYRYRSAPIRQYGLPHQSSDDCPPTFLAS